MYRPLVPCPACARHVLASETTCPFCVTALPTDIGDHAVPGAPGRLNRAAAFVFGASLAVAGCSSEVNTGSSSSGGGGAGGSGQETDAGPDDDGGIMPLYGDPPPPEDAGVDAPADDGGGFPLYGGPPPPDAGDDGGGFPLYGAPPKP